MLRDIANPISNQNRWNSAFEIAMFLILGLGMMVLAPIILSRNIANNFARPSGRRKSMEGLVLSLLLLVIPILGAITLSNIVDLLGIFLIRGAPIIEIIQDVGFSIAPMFWLARYLFFADSPLAMRLDDGAMRHRMLRSFRVVLLGIAVVYALGIFVIVVESSEDWTPQITSVLFFPLIVAMSMLLWQIGTGMRQYYALTYAAEVQENAIDSAPKETFLPFIFTTFIAVLPLTGDWADSRRRDWLYQSGAICGRGDCDLADADWRGLCGVLSADRYYRFVLYAWLYGGRGRARANPA